MEVTIEKKTNKYYKNTIKTVLSLAIMFFVFIITGSSLIAAVLGTTVLKVGEVLKVIYDAYRAGRSISAAVSAVMGPGAAAGFLISVLVGYGISVVMNSPGLKSY